MASPQQRADFNRRGSGNNAGTVPLPVMPDVTKHLASLAKKPKDKEALQDYNTVLGAWLKGVQQTK